MVCKGTPPNIDKYDVVTEGELVNYLIAHNIHPLYFDDTAFYFTKTNKCRVHMSNFRQKILEKGGR